MDLVAALQGVPGVGPVLPYLTVLMAICALVAAALPAPTPQAPVLWIVVYRVVNLLAVNVGRAANHDDAKAAARPLDVLDGTTKLRGLVYLLAVGTVLSACANGQLTPAGQAAVGAGVTLASVAAAQNKDVAAVVAGGQLFCAGTAGVFALLAADAKPSSVIGQTAPAVATACKAVDAIAVPVSPPANAGAVPAIVPPVPILPPTS